MGIIYLLLFLITEIETIKITNNISSSWLDEVFLIMHSSGYKIKKGEEKNILMKIEELLTIGKTESIMLFIMHFIPGINILSEYIYSENSKNKILSNEDIKKYTSPMTKEENEQYNMLESKREKLGYINYLLDKEDENDKTKLKIKDGVPAIINLSVTAIINDRLLPLAYTLDEVEELNKVTNESYQIGKIDGVNTAIVGYPKNASEIKKVSFLNDGFNETHKFEEINDDEKDTFIVYPYEYDEELEKKYNEAIEKISKERDIKNKINKISDKQLFEYINNKSTKDKPKQYIK